LRGKETRGFGFDVTALADAVPLVPYGALEGQKREGGMGARLEAGGAPRRRGVRITAAGYCHLGTWRA
jgi:hypothetical protein